MIPQSMKPIMAVISILLGLLVIANHWTELVSKDSDILASHVLGFVCLISGLNFMSGSSANVEEVQPRYQEDAQTKF
jgi:sorbitol-specific phosphotransferase system component IIBC